LKIMKRMGSAIFIILAALLVASICQAQARAPAGKTVAQDPIRITSDRLEADQGAHKMEFVGNVVARQGDLTIYARNLEIFYGPENHEVERAEAHGDVRVVQGDRVATGQQGTFFRKEGKIVLTGSPRVHQGQDFVEGDEITVFLNEDRSIVKGGGDSRVNAVFNPGGETQ
jgi:lipopolysaccharide export system protein LptA